jgi:hypothetical protein
MFTLKNDLIRDTIARLKDPDNWNPDGPYLQGKSCIVTACFHSAADRSEHRSCSHVPTLKVISQVIKDQYEGSRDSLYARGTIIGFNDHPRTTHADVMEVLHRAEHITRPFWRKPLQVAA